MLKSVNHEESSETSSNDEDAEAENADCTLIVTEKSKAPTRHRCFIPLPGAKSKVWKYFAFEADDNGRIQDNSVAVGYSKNTTNLLKHLERHYPTEYSEIQVNSDTNSDNHSQQPQCSSKLARSQTRITDT